MKQPTPTEDESRERVEAHAEMFRERLLAVESGLWNTQAAIAALFISAASVMASFGDVPRWALLAIMGSASAVLLLLHLNYRARRAMYRFLGRPPPDEVWTSQQAFARYMQTAAGEDAKHKAAQKSCEHREMACDGLLFVAVLLLAFCVYSAGRHV